MSDMPKIEVREVRAASYDEAVQSAATALDAIAGWYADDGFSLTEFVARCTSAWVDVSGD